jgi:hypothetical protein
MIQRKSSVEAPRTLIIVAWFAMLLASNLATIIWRELASGEPYWWPWVHALGLITLFAISLFSATLKPLRRFIVVLLILFSFDLSGAWGWGLIPFIRASQSWISWTSQTS